VISHSRRPKFSKKRKLKSVKSSSPECKSGSRCTLHHPPLIFLFRHSEFIPSTPMQEEKGRKAKPAPTSDKYSLLPAVSIMYCSLLKLATSRLTLSPVHAELYWTERCQILAAKINKSKLGQWSEFPPRLCRALLAELSPPASNQPPAPSKSNPDTSLLTKLSFYPMLTGVRL
jgi:hypothetical protein